MEQITDDAINKAIESLKRSGRGQRVMRDALAFLDDSDAIGLDQFGVRALLLLMAAALTTKPGSARDAMREALGD